MTKDRSRGSRERPAPYLFLRCLRLLRHVLQLLVQMLKDLKNRQTKPGCRSSRDSLCRRESSRHSEMPKPFFARSFTPTYTRGGKGTRSLSRQPRPLPRAQERGGRFPASPARGPCASRLRLRPERAAQPPAAAGPPSALTPPERPHFSHPQVPLRIGHDVKSQSGVAARGRGGGWAHADGTLVASRGQCPLRRGPVSPVGRSPCRSP